MASKVDICNMALTRLGQGRIASLSQAGLLAEMCTLYYEPTLEELLSTHSWVFAIKRVALAASSDTNLTEYDYMYTLPSDSLRVLNQISSDDYSDLTEEYRIEGQFLLSDLSPNYIKYITKNIIATDLPQLFVEPFYLRMATKMCVKITQDQKLLGQIFQEYSGSMLSAMAIITGSSREVAADETGWSD